MAMKGQFGEPWTRERTPGEWGVRDAKGIYMGGFMVGTMECEQRADRIVACVNACDGIPDPVEAVAKAREALKAALAVTEPEGARATSSLIRETLAALGDDQ